MLKTIIRKLYLGECRFWSYKEQQDFELEQALKREKNQSFYSTIF